MAEAEKSERSALSKALGSLFEAKIGESLEHGFIKSIGQLQRLLVLFVLMGVFAAATALSFIVFVISLTYALSQSAQTTSIAAIIISAIVMILTVLFFKKVLSQRFWLGIFNLQEKIPAPDLPRVSSAGPISETPA